MSLIVTHLMANWTGIEKDYVNDPRIVNDPKRLEENTKLVQELKAILTSEP